MPGALVSALVVAFGCTGSGSGIPDDELGSLVLGSDTRGRGIDVARAGRDADELLRAALLPHERVRQALGAHRFRSKVSTRVSAGGQEVEALEVETSIDTAADGAFHARSQNSRDYGFEVVFAGGDLYLAPRYSRFHRRAPERASEPEDIRANMYGELGAHLELLARALTVDDRGVQPLGGRSAHQLAITKAARAREPAGEVLEHRKWRDTVIVDEARGELFLDQETGIPLRAMVHGAVSFERDGQHFVMSFDVEHEISDIGAAVQVEAPPEDRWVRTPLRSTEVDERDLLLEGIAPPTRQRQEASGDTP